MSHYYQTAEKGGLSKVGFDYIDAEGLADLQAQVGVAGIAPTINTGDVHLGLQVGKPFGVDVIESGFCQGAFFCGLVVVAHFLLLFRVPEPAGSVLLR